MSEEDPVRFQNISYNNFTEVHKIFDSEKKLLVNLHISYPDEKTRSIGTMFQMHGYGGSPWEPFFEIQKNIALSFGFDVVSIEGVAISATSGIYTPLENKNIDAQKKAIFHALKYSRHLKKISHNYKIASPHSVSSHALFDLMLDSKFFVHKFFDEVIAHNPYLLISPKLQKSKNKYMIKDPTGLLWNSFSQRASKKSRNIEGLKYEVEINIKSVDITPDKKWYDCKDYIITETDLMNIAKKASNSLQDIYINFILGSKDKEADPAQTKSIYDFLDVKNKNLINIQDAGHNFNDMSLKVDKENPDKCFEEYALEMTSLISDMKNRALSKNKALSK